MTELGNTPRYNPYSEAKLEKPLRPHNRLPISVVSTIIGIFSVGMCCIGTILGAMAIVFATQSKTKYDREDYNGAESSSQIAFVLSIISLSISLLSVLIFVFIYLIAGFSAISDVIPSIDGGIIDRLI